MVRLPHERVEVGAVNGEAEAAGDGNTPGTASLPIRRKRLQPVQPAARQHGGDRDQGNVLRDDRKPDVVAIGIRHRMILPTSAALRDELQLDRAADARTSSGSFTFCVTPSAAVSIQPSESSLTEKEPTSTSPVPSAKNIAYANRHPANDRMTTKLARIHLSAYFMRRRPPLFHIVDKHFITLPLFLQQFLQNAGTFSASA